MARLIPCFLDDNTPPGERDVFNMLVAGPDDWVALHALDLAPWNRGLRTEIDFLIIVPDTGILCMEVKSHRNLSFENDRWNPPEIRRSPFKQAADGRYTFYRRLRDLAPQFQGIPIVHCCVFPNATFDLRPNLSVQPWELIDGRCFRQFSSGEDFCADLKARMQMSVSAEARLQPLAGRLMVTEIEQIIDYCVPVQKRRPDAREEIRHREQEVVRLLREQQRPVLQLAALNARLVVDGGAGTGKTLIAMEVARRAAEQGWRVALLCFNQLIGEWIKARMDRINPPIPNLIAGRAIRVLVDMAGLRIPDNPARDFWETELPDRLEERITDPDFEAAAYFDYLVLDEAQDILARPRLWQCLIQFLSGGIEQGRYAIFGDFDNQILADRDQMDQSLAALNIHGRPVHWRLAENCRNYRIIGDTAVRLANLGHDVYADYLRTGGGIRNYDIFFYGDDREQLEQIAKWLKEFRAEGYRPDEITILSFRSPDTCAAGKLKDRGYKLRPAWQEGECTKYASIQAFKGMENKIVILTDVVLGDPDFHRYLFYTGMTRAVESVRVLCDKNSQKILFGWLTGRVDT